MVRKGKSLGFGFPDLDNPGGEFGGVGVHSLQRIVLAHVLALGSCQRHLAETAKQSKDGQRRI